MDGRGFGCPWAISGTGYDPPLLLLFYLNVLFTAFGAKWHTRVSTRSQKEDRQLIALQEFGVAVERIVVEKQSGKNFDQPLYQDLVLMLCPGDVLVAGQRHRH